MPDVNSRLGADCDLRHTFLSPLSEPSLVVHKNAAAGGQVHPKQANMSKGEKSAQIEAPAASAEDTAPLRKSLIRVKASRPVL